MIPGWRRIKLGIVGATFSVCTAAIFIRPVTPRFAPEPEARELFAAVLQEIDALREADYPRAYRQVSFSMQEKYNIETFTDFVRLERPSLARAERIEFGAIRVQGRRAWVPAYFFLRSGEISSVLYFLVLEEGRWKIDGTRQEHQWERGHRVGGART
jgi:hypothetical protein